MVAHVVSRYADECDGSPRSIYASPIETGRLVCASKRERGLTCLHLHITSSASPHIQRRRRHSLSLRIFPPKLFSSVGITGWALTRFL